jgi:hypothetical protein
MKVQTHIKAGDVGFALTSNHNEAQPRPAPRAKGLRVKTSVKAGGIIMED